MNIKNNNSTLHEDKYTFFIISLSVLLRKRNVQGKKFVEKIKTHILCSITFISKITPYIRQCERNIVSPGKPQMTLQYGARALQAGYLTLQTHTTNM